MDHNYRKLINQLIGKENVFGYRNTIINQLHLLYWFLGEFYHSNMFNQHITLFWRLCNIISVALLFGNSIAYTFFSSNHNIVKLLFALQVVTATANLLITIPQGTHLHRHHTVEMFKILDKFDDLPVQPIIAFTPRQKISPNSVYLALCAQLVLSALYIICTYLDLMFGYHPGKLTDPNYYIYPTYSDNVRSLKVFLALLSSQVLTTVPVCVMIFLVAVFPMIIMREFYSKFQHLSDFIDYRSKLFDHRYEQLLLQQSYGEAGAEMSTLQRTFLEGIHNCAVHHHILLSGISHMKYYLEFFMSTIFFNFIYIEILMVYIFTMVEEVSVWVKFKIVGYSCITAIMLLVNCFVADSFTTMGEMFSNSVYNIPWYYVPPASRKSVQLLLHQAQVVIEFRALKRKIGNLINKTFPTICAVIFGDWKNNPINQCNKQRNSLNSQSSYKLQ